MNQDALKLENQLCFPLYACAKEVVRKYKPYLDPLGLTYTQYITMMVMWEHKNIAVKDIGARLYLDSGTLTPVLKKLETLGYVRRVRSQEDERSVNIELTEEGLALKERAAGVPAQISSCISLEPAEAMQLYQLLYKILQPESTN